MKNAIVESVLKSKKIYGLLVGINQYERYPLGGCVNDINNFKTYLKNNSGFECKLKTLQDKEAAKNNIILSFREHLSLATKEDTIVFYYSGHGTKETADPVWKKEATTDGIECIVCYNDQPNFLLADKELRFLLHELWIKTQAHIVVIMDCCHSADNTRGELIKEAFKKSKVRRVRLSNFFPQRDWNDFIFSDKISYEEAKSKASVNDFLPEGNHIQLAACESDESALEVDDNGVFTNNLIKVLKSSSGSVTYNALIGRIQNYMKTVYEQKPRIYFKGNQNLAQTIFLNKGLDDSGHTTEIIFNTQHGWVISSGAVHGIKAGTVVDILDNENNLLGNAIVNKVRIDFSDLDIGGLNLKRENAYRATTNEMIFPLAIQLKNYDTNPLDLEKIINTLLTQAGSRYDFKQEGKIDYALHFKYGRVYLTKFNDDYRPLFKPLSIEKDANELAQHLRDISRWHYMADLKNENSSGILNKSISIEVWRVKQDGTEEKLDTFNNIAVFDFENITGKWRGNIKIRITNHSEQKLYVCAAYLTDGFGIDTSFLPQKVQLVEPGFSTFLRFKSNEQIPIFVNQVTKEYNWEKNIEYLIFIISTEIFSDAAFVQKHLPRPPVLSDKNKAIHRGMGTSEEDELVEISDWTTQKLTLEFRNPVFNQVDLKELETMLAFDEMTEFVLGNYFDLVKNEQLHPEFKLKPHLKVPTNEKSLFLDITLNTANLIENVRRKWVYNAVKNKRMRIVAEGDSWFQYPFYIKEIIDQLSPLYAIYSLAVAGDTLENYMKRKEYLDAIDEQEPKLYLVSGGGNDILGKQFASFIKENDEVGLPPEEYLTPKFASKLKDLEKWYAEMFAEVKIPTIVHGYDYIFPVNVVTSPDESSWAGKYMYDKGIKNPTDQRKIIIYIMDEFNTMLEKLSGQFNHVHYINTRGLVPDKINWYDEIHPNDTGFNTIAIQFVNKINQLLKSGAILN